MHGITEKTAPLIYLQSIAVWCLFMAGCILTRCYALLQRPHCPYHPHIVRPLRCKDPMGKILTLRPQLTGWAGIRVCCCVAPISGLKASSRSSAHFGDLFDYSCNTSSLISNMFAQVNVNNKYKPNSQNLGWNIEWIQFVNARRHLDCLVCWRHRVTI